MARIGPETEFRNWQHIPGFPEGVDEFTHGYLEAVAFTDMQDTGDDAHGCEFAPEAVTAAAADCARFQSENAAPLALAYGGDDYDAYQAGRDFWFARNGHGVGFTDRDALPDALAEALQGNARGYPERNVYAGDDGLAYID